MRRPPMRQLFAPTPEAQDDIFYGQIALIAARWFVIVAGVALTLWSADTVGAITLPIALMVALMALNFALHTCYLVRRPLNGATLGFATAIDLTAITLIVALWPHGAGRGLDSPFFVVYYPVLLAAALVFPPRLSLACAALTLVVYGSVVLAGPHAGGLAAQRTLAERLLTLGASAGLGAFFWRLQRRGGAGQARHDALLRDLEQLTGHTRAAG